MVNKIVAQKESINAFRLRPLPACIRLAVASGFLMGSVSPVQAELPIPAADWAAMGANSASLQVMDNGNTLHIDQFDQNVILNWDKFNVGQKNKVEFNQPNSASIALNRILKDDSPSQILGQVTANGQIYLYNPNGFVFGANSSINVGSLVASSLYISDETLTNGLTNQIKQDKPALGVDASDVAHAARQDKSIIVEKGAKIFAKGDANNDGLVILAAPHVSNQGSIATNEFGQAILVASKDRVYLQPTEKNTQFSGLLVEVDTGGDVTNAGDILVRQGNITMQGLVVNQRGRLTATTSVNVNGSIRLLAQEGHSFVSGVGISKLIAQRTVNASGDKSNVSFDSKSLTQILPEYIKLVKDDDLKKLVDNTTYEQILKKSISEIDSFGNEIHLIQYHDLRLLIGNSAIAAAYESLARGIKDTKDYSRIIDRTVINTAISDKPQAQSYMEVVAHDIALKPHSSIVAPSAQVNMVGTSNLAVIRHDAIDSSGKKVFAVDLNLAPKTDVNLGHIQMDKNALIDVSGVQNVQVAMERNVQAVSVQTNDLRDAPYQKGGVLQGEKVYIDTRNDTKIVDISGAINSIQRTVNEQMTTGGQVNLNANGGVILSKGAVVDISGGSIEYQDGYISTTKLVTDYGTLIDISKAGPLEHFASLFTSVNGEGSGIIVEVHEDSQGHQVVESWDFSALFGVGRVVEKGYSEGKDAGSIDIHAPLLSWQADLIAGAMSGINQRNATDMPFGGAFALNDRVTTENEEQLISSQNILFQDGYTASKSKNNSSAPLVLSNAIFNNSKGQKGYSKLEKIVVRTFGNIEITQSAVLDNPKADIHLEADSFDVSGRIDAASGSITLSSNAITLATPNSGEINLGGTAVLDVSGKWINDFQLGFSATPMEPLLIAAGTVNLTAKGDITTDANSVIRADGGAHLSFDNKLTEGKAGSISLAALQFLGQVNSLQLKGGLSAWALSQGGTLNLTSGNFIVGSAANYADIINSGTTVLTVSNGNFDSFDNSGFASINLNSELGSLVVSADTHLKLIAENRQFAQHNNPQDNNLLASSGRSLNNVTHIATLTEDLRNPVNLGLNAFSGVTLETGSEIIADTGATINLMSETKGIYVDGTIAALAGNISLALKNTSTEGLAIYDNTQAIWLGSHAQLLATGTTIMKPETLLSAIDRRSGQVLDGGKVTLLAQEGYVIEEKGALIDVSGTKALLDLPVTDTKTSAISFRPTQVGSNAGIIAVSAGEGAVFEGGIKGNVGNKTTQGGRFDLTLDPSKRNINSESVTNFPQNPKIIQISQHTTKASVLKDADGKALAFGDAFDKFSPGTTFEDTGLNGKATVSADLIASGGFDDVRLRSFDGIRFVGSVDLTAKGRIELNTQKLSWEASDGAEGGSANLNTTYLKAGWDASNSAFDFNDPLQKGKGIFSANTTWIDLIGNSRWDGFKRINLTSSHDMRTTGVFRLGKYSGSFKTAANVNLNASQIYPSTLTDFSFTVDQSVSPNGSINLYHGGNIDQTPLSANGKLSFVAANINQDGVLKAPFGTIDLHASKKLTLGKDSITSVSSDGKTIPFGNTLGGEFWTYTLQDGTNLVYNDTSSIEPTLNNRPIQAKLINMTAPDISIVQGSNINISGGGDLKAYEFIPGPGGSSDYLLPGSASYQGGFAIVPSQGVSMLAAYDPYEQKQLNALSESQQQYYGVGSQIYLNGTGQLKAGSYTVLPAHYALLPGAFLVTPKANTQDQTVTTYDAAGRAIVSGYLTNTATNTRDARTSGYLIESSAEVRKHSEYKEETANSFFSAKAAANGTAVPLIPKDSGQIAIDVSNSLLIEGTINSTAALDGRGGKLDISTSKGIKVVEELSVVSNKTDLEIKSTDLNNLNLDSLFLGGIRSRNNATGETNLTVNAKTVEVETGVSIKVKDLILSAKNQVVIKSGAALTASGTVNTGDSVFTIKGYGALLRVSSDKQVSLSQDSTRLKNGGLVIEEGAVINGVNTGAASSILASVLVDSSKSTQILGDILMTGGSLSLNANAINIGSVTDTTNTSALSLTNEQLNKLVVDELQLNSRSSINFYGQVGKDENTPLQFGKLVINAASLSGFDNTGKQVRLQADSLILQNTSANGKVVGTGTGVLDILTNDYTQAGGNFSINGFNAINIRPFGDNSETSEFHVQGENVLNVAGDFNLTTDYVTAEGGASIAINVAGHDVSIQNAGHIDITNTISSGFGASVNITANTINFDTSALLYSGKLALHALEGNLSDKIANNDGVYLGDKASVHLEGKRVKFADIYDDTPGGIFSATADHGKIILAANSKVDLNSGGDKAEGGQLLMKAPEQTIDLLGTITASSGSAIIDLAKYSAVATKGAGFDQWMDTLKNIGITESIYFRSREADILQGADKIIQGTSVTLVADKGSIGLSGTLDTNGTTQGGAIGLYAGDKITLESTSILTAKGKKGGDVLLSAVDADEDGNSGIIIKSGASIDVSGDTNAQGGDVTLRALRDDNTVIKINAPTVNNTVKGAHNYFAEGVKKYTGFNNGIIDDVAISEINNDTSSYMTTENIAQVSNVVNNNIVLRPGIEIAYKGDLTLASVWDFNEWRYGNDIAGNLVVSASGKLTVSNSISDAYDSSNILQGGNSWSYQLVAGADVDSDGKFSADNFATINASGHNLELASSASNPVTVRTGVGDIKLAAGGDVVLKNKFATVYSAGRPSETKPKGILDDAHLFNVDYSNLIGAEYAVDGGDVIIKADNNIQGAVSNQFTKEWLLRTPGDWGSTSPLEDGASRIATAWGVYVDEFRQNIGSFGGGNVTVTAQGNINDLSVMMPSSGKQTGTIAKDVNGNELFNSNGSPIFETNTVEVAGGGQMSVKAGGNIAGGAYLLGKGDGAISADGEITGGKQFSHGPQLVMGDSTLNLHAKQDISIAAISDQMSISDVNQFYTYTDNSGVSVKSLSGDVYLGSDTSKIGNLMGLSNESYLQETSIYPVSLETTAFGGSVLVDTINLFPATTSKLTVLAQQNIKAKSTDFTASGVFMRDTDLALIPTTLKPFKSSDDYVGAFQDRLGTALDVLHKLDSDPARLVTQKGDIQDIKVVLSKQSIIQAGQDLINLRLDLQNINSNDVTTLSAGRDIVQNTTLNKVGILDLSPNRETFIQVSGPGDVLLKTGRNLDLGISKGVVTRGNELNSNLDNKGASITVLAGLNGRDPNYSTFISQYLAEYPSDNNFSLVKNAIADFMRNRLGDNNGSLSTDDALKLFNDLKPDDYAALQAKLTSLILPIYEKHPNLSYQGVTNKQIKDSLADSSSEKYDAMIDKYLQHFSVAEKLNNATNIVTAFMRERSGDAQLTASQAFDAFKALSSDDYLGIQQQLNNAVLPIYYNEIKESGAASATDKTLGNDRAFTAINTLFAGSEKQTGDTAYPWKGDVNLAFSTIQTVKGGDINLLVPGGKVNAGLTFAFPGLEYNKDTNPNGRTASELGIIAQGLGDVNAVVRGDISVNISRIFTQSGGGIALWSTEGNIDAGKGSKTALAVPEAVVNYSTSGKATFIRPAVAGSGIRAAASQSSIVGQGDVFLFAPGGVVNAGEAGIEGSNVTISATAVLGANNIQVGGVSTGVSSAVSSPAAGLSGVSNMAANVSQIAQAATETNDKDSEKTKKTTKLGVLSVEFIGHGDEAPNSNNKNKPRPSY